MPTERKLIEALAEGLENRIAKRGDQVLTNSSLATLLRMVLAGRNDDVYLSPEPPPQLHVRPDYPKTLIRQDRETGKELGRVTVHSVDEHVAYMDGSWYAMTEADYAREAETRQAEENATPEMVPAVAVERHARARGK